MAFYHGILLYIVHIIIAVKASVQAWLSSFKTPLQFRRKRTRTRLKTDAKSLKKLPLHVGLVMLEDELSYQDVANIIVWCMAMGISYISLYDTEGIFKRNYVALNEEISKQQEEILGEEATKYSYQIYKSGKVLGNKALSSRVHVNLVSPQDGRHDIVTAAKQFCLDIASKRRNVKDIEISTLAHQLQGSHFPDPDVVFKFGQVESVLGFLPFQIRLSEILSIASHRNIDYNTFLAKMIAYAGTQQRYGK
ncbi:dehydrodolichyl diphosphate synthase complex subunit nus1-like [Ptychodera flava]|uniref:dehydrodolichyl diphosphate synthase complex subunit nus1-like n=1 Tax=Ptychodera flava TaxID=63121 RepID=UPI00396A5E3B